MNYDGVILLPWLKLTDSSVYWRASQNTIITIAKLLGKLKLLYNNSHIGCDEYDECER